MKLKLLIGICLLVAPLSMTAQKSGVKLKGKNIEVYSGRTSFRFQPDFTLLYTDKDPNMQLKNLSDCNYFAPTWNVRNLPDEKIFKERASNKARGGDGIDDAAGKARTRRTADLWYAGERIPFVCRSVKKEKETIVIEAVAETYGTLRAEVFTDSLPYPAITYTFTPERDGYFSIAYTGAPAFGLNEVSEIWQPMVWQEMRFPQQSYLTLAFQCSLPATLATVRGKTVGVMADSREIPFQPLPTRDNNRFGVALRNLSGQVQSAFIAPVLGHLNSDMKVGEPFSATMRLVVSDEDVQHTYESAARRAFGFRDYRRNEISSVNRTMDRMVEYTLTPYSNFIDSLRGCSYSTDVPGSTKNVSSLHPLSIALVTDNRDLFERRAYPVMEYMLSRDNTLFCLDTTQKVQRPSRKLGRPCAPVSELAGLYDLTGHTSSFLLDWTEDKFYRYAAPEKRQHGRGLWNDCLELYRATGDKAYLDWAVRGGNFYVKNNIDTPRTGLKSEFFWITYAPKYISLLELYEETHDPVYLEAAHKAARYYAMFVWMCPEIPADSILVNKDGKAPWYWYLKSRGIPQQSAPEETVEAWRLSEIGLTAESSTTGIGHRAVFMAHHAPYFLRIAHYTGDTFLRDIARSAVVGRYRNFPGYHINTERNTAYEQIDFPMHWHNEISATSFHYNHPFPHISILIDYLVTDAFDKSDEKIAFPSKHIEGYGYLQNKFYGHAPGRFYGDKNVWLWMPAGIAASENVELNYLSARGDDAFYIAWMNQSAEEVTTAVTLDTERLATLRGKRVVAEVWRDNRRVADLPVVDGKCEITVSPKGITALVVRECPVQSDFQQAFARKGEGWKNDSFYSEFGDMSALWLNMGEGLKRVYLFLRDDDSVFREVNLLYRFDDGKFKMMNDAHYPFEFSIPLPEGVENVYLRVTGIDVNGNVQEGELFKLSKE